VYEKVRIVDGRRCEQFIRIFSDARCRMVEMTSEQHDESIADAEFVTHLTGRLLVKKNLLPLTPVVSKEYAALSDVTDMIAGDSFDTFFGMYKFNDRAKLYLALMRDNLAALERQLAAKEAYLEARMEIKNSDRQRLLAETRRLLLDVTRDGGLWNDTIAQDSNATETRIRSSKHKSDPVVMKDDTHTDS
jgi:prephenate dehydrogenase